MKKQLLKTAVATCALALVGVCNVNATTAALRWSTDGINWAQTVFDNGAGDLLPSDDGYMLVTVVAGTWSLQVTTSQSKPQTGSATAPILDISIAGSTGTGTTPVPTTSLWIEFSDTGFGPVPTSSFHTSVGGNLGGGNSEVFSTRASSANDLFGSTVLLTTLNATGTPFSEEGYASGTGLGAPYSITLSHVLTSGRIGGLISTDGRIAATPDGGSSLVLLGLSLLGLAGLRRKA